MSKHYILLADCKDEIGITSLISTIIKDTNSNFLAFKAFIIQNQ